MDVQNTNKARPFAGLLWKHFSQNTNPMAMLFQASHFRQIMLVAALVKTIRPPNHHP